MGVIVRPELNDGMKPVFGSGYRLNPDHPLNKGLVAWALLNERAGAICDIARCVWSALSGNDYWTQIYGGGVYFPAEGTSDINLGSVNVGSNITVAMRVLLPSIAGGHYIGGVGLVGSQPQMMSITHSWGTISATVIDASWSSAAATKTGFAAGQMQTVIGVCSGGTISVYLNGVRGTDAATPAGTHSGVGNLVLGSTPYASNGPQAAIVIGECAVWTRAIEISEVMQYQITPYGTPDNPRLLFPSGGKYFVPSEAGGGTLPLKHPFYRPFVGPFGRF